MSGKKVKDVESIYSGGSTKRSRILDDISCSSNVTSAGWTSILSCCWRRGRGRKPTFKEYDANEWDYIVEKLVVKRVPLSLYATEEDFEDFLEERKYKESSYGPGMGPAVKDMRDKQVYSAMPEMGSNLYFFKNKARGDLSSRPSSKNLRFNRDEDLLDEDVVQAGPSNYSRELSLRMREVDVEDEYLNRFSALHPDLKESERPPKDPDPLNPPRSKRSLAENISEIASAKSKKGLGAKSKKGKERLKLGSDVYVTASDTSREISTVLGEEEIPTRDKNVAKTTPAIFSKIGSTSCLPYYQKRSKTPGVESAEGRQNRREVNSANNEHQLLEKPDDRGSNTKSGLKASRFKMHYVSPEQHSMSKVVGLIPSELETGFKTERKNYAELTKSAGEKSVTDATSYASDDLKNTSPPGTTLRWKIIIKHHQPTALQTASQSASDLSENSTLPIPRSFNRTRPLNTKADSFDKTATEDKMQRLS